MPTNKERLPALRCDGLVRRFWRGEVRLNEDMTVDEVVASNVGVHIEQMADDHWWMSIDGKLGRRLVLNFSRRGKRIHLSVEDDGNHSSGISEGFNPPNIPDEPPRGASDKLNTK